MDRMALSFLTTWLSSSNRKPLVIRGARQVGKTWIVRRLAELTKKELIELNFEKQPQLASLFSSNFPEQILLELSAAFNKNLRAESIILFLDEIQAVPTLLAKLRWFAETMPELPVIAAGSLLEFVLESHSFSMPVGRIQYMHLEPLSFEEFLLAQDKTQLIFYLQQYQFAREISLTIHQTLIDSFKEYILIGGMPAMVANWIEHRSFPFIHQISHDLMATYRDDFAKYTGKITIERLEEALASIPRQLGQKFVFSKINPTSNFSGVKQTMHLLNKARLCHPVYSTAANGIPLAAEKNEKFFKEIFLDVGLCSTALGLMLNQIKSVQEITHINSGAIAEQVAGQLLRTITPPYEEPHLYYWLREKKGSNAEIDYIIQHKSHVIPIEVKAGTTGSLKSLHLFMGLKKFSVAVRLNSNVPSITPVSIKDHEGNTIQYQLLSLPFYLLGQIQRLLDDMIL